MYLDPDLGGLGLINLDTYLVGLHVAWVKKAATMCIDNWGIDLRSLTCGNPYILGTSLQGINLMPGLEVLATDMERFVSCFVNSEANYKKAYIINNKLFEGQGGRLLTQTTFQQNRPFLNLEKIGKLKFCDIFQDTGPYSLDELCAGTGINFSLVTYMRMHENLGPSRARLSHKAGTDSQSVDQFLQVKSGVSKKVRKFLDKNVKKVPVQGMRTVSTFFRLTGLNADEKQISKIWSLWNFAFLPNKIREFIFKFVNNQLSINTRLSHYVQNRTRGCTLCTISGTVPVPVPDETFSHLFYECGITSSLHAWFMRKYNLPAEDRKKIFFLGLLGENNEYNIIIHIMGMLIQFFIWEMKIFKRIYSGTTVDIDFEFVLRNCFKNRRRLLQDRDALPREIKNCLQWRE
jgi:hypothetical protein